MPWPRVAPVKRRMGFACSQSTGSRRAGRPGCKNRGAVAQVHTVKWKRVHVVGRAVVWLPPWVAGVIGGVVSTDNGVATCDAEAMVWFFVVAVLLYSNYVDCVMHSHKVCGWRTQCNVQAVWDGAQRQNHVVMTATATVLAFCDDKTKLLQTMAGFAHTCAVSTQGKGTQGLQDDYRYTTQFGFAPYVCLIEQSEFEGAWVGGHSIDRSMCQTAHKARKTGHYSTHSQVSTKV